MKGLIKKVKSPRSRSRSRTVENKFCNDDVLDRRQRSSSLDKVTRNQDIELLKSIFPSWESGSLEIIFEAHGYNIPNTIDSILRIDASDKFIEKERNAVLGKSTFGGKPKNLLPDDFLRIPGQRFEKSKVEENDNTENIEEERAFALDDGTLCGRALSEQIISKSEELPPSKLDSSLFCPEESISRISFLDTLGSEAIQRSRLDISGAELRLRRKENHTMFDFLAKASQYYQNGIINSKELEVLRDLVLNLPRNTTDNFQSKDLSGIVNDRQWNGLIFKCKGLRRALSIRIIRHDLKYKLIPGVLDPGHAEYYIRVVDIETGSVWFVCRRFKEFHRLHKKVVQLSTRLQNTPFPHKRPKKFSDEDLATERQPVLQEFMRVASSLVVPIPISFLRGCVLKELQKFLEVPKRFETLERLRISDEKKIQQEFRVFTFEILSDPQSQEGKACTQFIESILSEGMNEHVLSNLAEFLDNVQTYMLQKRHDSMKAFISQTSLVNSSKLSVDIHTAISDAIRHEVEERVYIPLMSGILLYLESSFADEEYLLAQKLSILRGKPQSYFEIPIDKISLSSWQSVVDDLNRMDTSDLPSDKFKALVAAANQIHSVYKQERELYTNYEFSSKRDSESSIVLSGDDFLPIYIYAIVQSKLEHPLVTQRLLSALCDPEKRLGETGYYVASFEAAIHHLVNSNLEES